MDREPTFTYEPVDARELTQLGVPDDVAASWRRFTAPLKRSVIVAREDERVVGAALCVRRQLGEYLKIAGIWTADRDPGLEAALQRRAEHEAWAQGALVVKREVASGSNASPGYQSVPIPPMPSPIPDVVDHVPGADFRWREPRTATTVPYVRQTSVFTCGPCSLMMALSHFGAIPAPDRKTEFALWREATMVEACDPYGLALAAARHGLDVELTVTTNEFMLLEEFDSEQARNVRRFLQAAFREDLRASDVDLHIRRFSAEDVRAVLDSGRLAIVLISEDPFDQGDCPHWIVVHAVIGDVFLIHDPWTEVDAGESWVDGYDLPVRSDGLEQLAAYGDPAYSALLAVGPAL